MDFAGAALEPCWPCIVPRQMRLHRAYSRALGQSEVTQLLEAAGGKVGASVNRGGRGVFTCATQGSHARARMEKLLWAGEVTSGTFSQPKLEKIWEMQGAK